MQTPLSLITKAEIIIENIMELQATMDANNTGPCDHTTTTGSNLLDGTGSFAWDSGLRYYLLEITNTTSTSVVVKTIIRKSDITNGIRVEGFPVLTNCSSFALNGPTSLSGENADGNQVVSMLGAFTGGTYEVESKAGSCRIVLSSSSFSATVKRCV
ncbi:MAG: hypothetical protein ACOYNO_06355 [Saprospiraceae bacterium]